MEEEGASVQNELRSEEDSEASESKVYTTLYGYLQHDVWQSPKASTGCFQKEMILTNSLDNLLINLKFINNAKHKHFLRASAEKV